MFDDKTQPSQRVQNLNNDQGAAKVAPPERLPTGVVSTPNSATASTPTSVPTPPLGPVAPVITPRAAPTLPANENLAADDIFERVNEPDSPGPVIPKTQPASLSTASTAPQGPVVGTSAQQAGAGNGSQQQPPIPDQQAVLPEQMMNGIDDKKLSFGKKVLIILITVTLMAALASLGYWLYGKLSVEDSAIDNLEIDSEISNNPPAGPSVDEAGEARKQETRDDGDKHDDDGDVNKEEEIIKDIEQEVEGKIEENIPIIPPLPSAPEVPIDTDGDGLTDEEELALGTNPQESDSDKDGLSDRDEVEIYQTDPLNQDSDGDGYLDGDEVEHGYDPKGPGRLLEIP